MTHRQHCTKKHTRSLRRGTVLVAVIVLLAIMQLIVATVVQGGGRDHDLTGRRAATMQAFYAAEAGMNMALREMMLAVDDDGDGGIGTISNDGNSNNDPTVGGARVSVSSSTTNAATTLSSTSRTGDAHRAIAAIIY